MPLVAPACPLCGLDDRAEVLPGRPGRHLYWCARCAARYDGSVDEWAHHANERAQAADRRHADELLDRLTADELAALHAEAEQQVPVTALGRRLEPQVRMVMRRLVVARNGASTSDRHDQ